MLEIREGGSTNGFEHGLDISVRVSLAVRTFEVLLICLYFPVHAV